MPSDVPAVEEYLPKVHERGWGQEIFIAETEHYLGKMLVMRAGTAGGLQHHVEKDETFYVYSGECAVDYVEDGEVRRESPVGPGRSFHIPPGAPHRVEALTDCVLFEASTPHYNDRVRDEETYGVSTIGGPGLPTTR
jgi:mannose-6-phosphate isomerase